jgi:spore coat protein A
MGLAERADVIVDFSHVPVGEYVLGNVGPDEPFGGGVPGVDFDVADPDSTGQVMSFRVVPRVGPDHSTPPERLQLPAAPDLPTATNTRKLALLEKAGVGFDDEAGGIEGPVEALLGVVSFENSIGTADERLWMSPVTENPGVGDTEIWEIYNTTGDAHPMHVHEVAFEVVDRQDIEVREVIEGSEEKVQVNLAPGSSPTPPEPWETGRKDTVTAYPGQVTRIRLHFEVPGQYVWHCHIVEHEDNEMMRPYRIGPLDPDSPAAAT